VFPICQGKPEVKLKKIRKLDKGVQNFLFHDWQIGQGQLSKSSEALELGEKSRTGCGPIVIILDE
jgi:hypothetical protein